MPAQTPNKDQILLRHLRFGWWSLLLFLTLGIVLEALHGFKIGGYLDLEQSSRRLMWTLAHAHGTLLSILNLGFAFTVEKVPSWPSSSRRLASRCLLLSTALLPGGFFLAGVTTYGGDPGIAVVLVAAGGLILLLAALVTARAVPSLSTNS